MDVGAERYGPDTVYVYWLSLHTQEVSEEAQYALLSHDERERASRFHLARDRLLYVYARASLRRLIGKALDSDPASLIFRYNAFGKPFLRDESGACPLEFNVSHTVDLAVIALSVGRPVGIDVEHPVAELGMENIAHRMFSVSEQKTLHEIPEPNRTAAFFRCWARKEAYLKMRGEGLSYPTDQFSVLLDEFSDDALIGDELAPGIIEKVQIRDLECPAGYVAAIALHGRNWKLEILGCHEHHIAAPVKIGRVNA